MKYVENRRWIHWFCILFSGVLLYQGYSWSQSIREKALAQEAINNSLVSTNNQLSQLSRIAKEAYESTLISTDVRDIYYLQGILSQYGLRSSEDVRVSKVERFTDRNKVDLGLTSLCLRSASNSFIGFDAGRIDIAQYAQALLANVAVNVKSIALDEKWRGQTPNFKTPEICFLVRD